MLIAHPSELVFSQIVNVGSGSYTQTFPGVDAAGRNGFPSGTPFVTGNAGLRRFQQKSMGSGKVLLLGLGEEAGKKTYRIISCIGPTHVQDTPQLWTEKSGISFH